MTARLPSLNGLRAFEAAARHLSFTVAASELNVTQTAISHQIRRLEEELGIRLFVRQNRALALTVTPEPECLAELREKPGIMMICHRFTCAGGHGRLQKLSLCRRISVFFGLSTNDTLRCFG